MNLWKLSVRWWRSREPSDSLGDGGLANAWLDLIVLGELVRQTEYLETELGKPVEQSLQ
jgi:hypothetical protein